MNIKLICTIFMFTFAIGIFQGCGSTPRKHQQGNLPQITMITSPVKVNIGQDPPLPQRLNQQYQNWRGVPYKMGGLNKKGIDCSGFVHVTFQKVFGLSIPRTTETLVKSGSQVDRDELAVGDLVFFKTGFGKRHVGIYIGNQRFIHASTSRGVMKSNLNSPYWDDTYWTSRRLIYQ